jgi:predicted metal-dependent TIM-barrel fold hydrolase
MLTKSDPYLIFHILVLPSPTNISYKKRAGDAHAKQIITPSSRPWKPLFRGPTVMQIPSCNHPRGSGMVMDGGVMTIIEPHIHMYSRTTDDYTRMYHEGIRAVVEPSFWLGANRRYAGTFWDYFELILDFEARRAERYGIDHFAAISVNPKEAENRSLTDEVIDGMLPYLDHPRCVAIGEIGFNRITPNEEYAFLRQLELAQSRGMLVIVHTPHDTAEVSKRAGTDRICAMLRELNYDPGRIVVDHNTEQTMDITRKLDGVWAGLTVYPYSKLNPERVAGIIRKWGWERTLVNSSADWGVSEPCSLPMVARHMRAQGFDNESTEQLLFQNPMTFYSQNPRFKPRLDLPCQDPALYQR